MSKLFVIWILANLLGFSALAVSVFALPSLMAVQGVVVTILIISIPISLAQWIGLRSVFKASVLWILSIPIGLLIYALIYTSIPGGLRQMMDGESIAVITASFLVIGFTIGLPQWLILRLRFFISSTWLLGSSLGLGIGFWFVLVTGLINYSEIVSYIVVMLIYAMVTGVILSWLLASAEKSNYVNAA